MGNDLQSKIYKFISNKREGDYWDFKQEWHMVNERLFLQTIHYDDYIGIESFISIYSLENDYIRKKFSWMFIAMQKCHLCHKSEPLRTNFRATFAITKPTSYIITD